MDFPHKDGILQIMVMTMEQPGAFRIGFLLIDGFALMSYASAVEPLRQDRRETRFYSFVLHEVKRSVRGVES